jgi:hypothetical protein
MDSDRNIIGLRRKPWSGYAVAFVVGAAGALVVAIVGPDFPPVDDTGFAQMMIGGLLGVVIYGLLFPLHASKSH